MSLTPHNRRVITFYSFKGGVGRTMTMANVAYRLANKHGLRVIAVDWDLEAPGLHRFFGVSPKKAATAGGVLEYFDAWRGAVERRDPAPPDVINWILPIKDKKHSPKFGSLSLLLAGKIDDAYNGRLAALNWQDFYKEGAGASAVETLRGQLAGMADVVLIDSRTGFTDAGGICTIQVPDGVVLMTAPNQQSLEGIGRVARGIGKAPNEARAGRVKPRMWLVTSRIPLFEETYLTEQWFKANEPWFAMGAKDGLWLKEDHPEGLKSHKIPHRGRWGFDETVLNEVSKADSSDLLSTSYDELAVMLFQWLGGIPSLKLDTDTGRSATLNDWTSILEEIEILIANAERRGDSLALAANLRTMALGLLAAGKSREAVHKAEQASAIYFSKGLNTDYLNCLETIGDAQNRAGEYEEAFKTLTKALKMARELGNRVNEVALLRELAETRHGQNSPKEALTLVRNAYAIFREINEVDQNSAEFLLLSESFSRFHHPRKAIEIARRGMSLARTRSEVQIEELAIRFILNYSNSGENLPDAEALRARLAEIKAAPPAST